MGFRNIKPTTAGLRRRAAPDFSDLSPMAPEKSLLAPLKKRSGRNHQGRITVPHRGGGHKRRYRCLDFMRKKQDIAGVVKSIDYDPNRTAFIALLHYVDGEKSYILAPDGLKVGQQVFSGEKVAPEVGNVLPMSRMPLGSIVHNIEMRPGYGGLLVRSAGTYAQLLAREGKYVTLKLPSGEMRQVLSACVATIGSVSNAEHMNEVYGKAGRARWHGRRPRVRGVAMNPVDHPMGGGEGKASGGHPRSRTNLYAKGKRTRARRKYSDRLILKKR